MPKSIAKDVEELGLAFIYAVILIGSVGFAFWSGLNLTIRPVYNASNASQILSYTNVLDTTQLLAWGLILTFMVLGVAFGFMSYMRKGGRKR